VVPAAALLSVQESSIPLMLDRGSYYGARTEEGLVVLR
jgi:hypothetical protein